ncbi:MAG: hypothetical protein ABI824_14855 [Acidobacteriota bacterium]
MPVKNLSMEDVIAQQMPGFRVAKTALPDAPLSQADAVTPSLETMQAKYSMASPSGSKRAAAKADSNAGSKSELVVVEATPGGAASDAPGKRLTVLVRDGKIRARQG